MSRVRTLWRRAVLPGMAVFGALFLSMFIVNTALSFMGNRDETLVKVVLDTFLWDVVLGALAVFGAALCAGALLGGVVGLCLAGCRDRWLGPKDGRKVALGVLLTHLVVWASHIRAVPQLHAELLYNRGGVWASLQRAITHGLPEQVFDALPWLGLLVAAFAIGRPLWRLRSMALRWLVRRGPVAVGLLLVIAGLGFWASRPGPRSDRLNILLIANDSMRPDRLGFGGYERDVSPALDAFAAESVVFERAYVPLARTFPSWASILSGRFPAEHGVRHMFPRAEDRHVEGATLPRVLGAHGYRSAMIGDYAADIFGRLEVGFESVQAPAFNVPALARQQLLQMQPWLLPYLDNRLGRWLFPDQVGLVNFPHTRATFQDLRRLVEAGDGRPFFITAFFSTNHFPYAGRSPYYRRYVDPAYRGPNLYQRYQVLGESAEVLRAEARQQADLFDGATRYFDDEFGSFMGWLSDEGYAENTLVVVLADHGESLGEHDTIGHGEHLRGDEQHHIPLLMHGPGLAPHRVEGLVRSVDLAPTLSRLAGASTDGFSGVDLAPMLTGARDDLGLLAFAETGLWFTTEGPGFFQRQRLHYPALTGVAEFVPDSGGEVAVQPRFEDRLRVAKHRAVWNLRHKVIYAPTPEGPVLEGWAIADDLSESPEPPDPSLVEALRDWARAHGRSEWIGGYLLPTDPVAGR